MQCGKRYAAVFMDGQEHRQEVQVEVSGHGTDINVTDIRYSIHAIEDIPHAAYRHLSDHAQPGGECRERKVSGPTAGAACALELSRIHPQPESRCGAGVV